MSDFGTYKKVKTRKKHSCIYCNRQIPVGTEAYNDKGMWEGDFQNWYACEFCDREVAPDYAEAGEPISGDEFNEWFYDSKFCECHNCKSTPYRHNWEWIGPTTIEVECGECDNVWKVEIGFN